MDFAIEFELEDDGRWITDIPALPGVMAYGALVAASWLGTRVVHNWGNGAEESALSVFHPHRAVGHYRWPRA